MPGGRLSISITAIVTPAIQRLAPRVLPAGSPRVRLIPR